MPDVTDLIGGVILFLALSVPIAAFYLRADSCKRAAPPRKGREMNLKSILDDHKAWLAGDGGRRADLRGADLSGAEGVLALPVSEPRGYRHIAVLHGAEWVIFAGCRRFTVAEARSHWCGDDYKGPTSVRETYPAALDWLAKQQQALEGRK